VRGDPGVVGGVRSIVCVRLRFDPEFPCRSAILTILAACLGLAGLISLVAGIRALTVACALRFTIRTLLVFFS